jgi:uncharacterized repeat protein (TIGR03803 family)
MKAVLVLLLAVALSPALAQPTVAAKPGKFQEQVVYSFCTQQKCTDGWASSGVLVEVNGILYGTTYLGGGTGCGGTGCGMVFAFNPATNTETPIYSFAGGKDGAYPVAGLINVNGTLYGTTQQGGNANAACYPSGCGTVFALDPTTGKETVLYSFCNQTNCADGANPYSDLISISGVLYGTTQHGGGSSCGGSNCGTVFAVNASSGAETVLHSFAGGTDGAYPSAGLLNIKGTLYGTTFEGGASGGGTVFSVDAGKGTETVLHSFECCTGADGGYPLADLVNVKGTLFGTTYGGGNVTGCTGGQGCGTVFSITTAGAESVVYAFRGGKDGAGPQAGLVSVKGSLYGTTGGQGTDGANAGTAFAINTKTGKEAVIYSFQGDPDAAMPTANLIDVDGTLFGTAEEGGTGECGTGEGCGALFSLTPSKGK